MHADPDDLDSVTNNLRDSEQRRLRRRLLPHKFGKVTFLSFFHTIPNVLDVCVIQMCTKLNAHVGFRVLRHTHET